MKLHVFAALGVSLATSLLAEKWSVDDLLFAERADQLIVSRDGALVVWVKSQMDREKGENVSNLVLRRLTDDFEIQLTRGSDNNSSPKFSPDGTRIAFLSNRKAAGPAVPAGETAASGGSQVWIIDVRGGEPWALTKFERGVRALDWVDDGHLLLAAPEDATLYDQKIKERKDTSNIVEDELHAPPVRLFLFDVKSRTPTRLTDNADRIARIVVSPDGAWAVTIHDRSLRYIYDQKVRPVTFLHDLKNHSSRQLFSDGKLLPGPIAWSEDAGKPGFYFAAPFSSHPVYNNASIEHLYYYDIATAKAAQVPLDWENGLAGGIAVTPGGVLALLANGARSKAAIYTRSGPAGDTWTRSWLEGDQIGNLASPEVTRGGKAILYRYSTASLPGQWFRADLDGTHVRNAKAITKLNAGFLKKPLATTELVRWKGARDEEVEGLLYYPQGYRPGRKYPLVVMIHGGPHGADQDAFTDTFFYPHNLMTQRGAFVLKPNYHGSSHYGLKWGESIAGGMYNELEEVDVEKGVDWLIAKGLVDPEKLGVMGWSNGSIITIELTTRTTRFKVASAGAGDVNWISDWGNAVFGQSFDDYYFGKTPLDDPQLYLKKSPLFRMDKVRTPTIIYFGTEDKQVPTEQGWQHYRALQHYGKADVRFILFPGEAHGPRKLVHQRRKLEEDLAWFDKYLFHTASDVNEALKPESPLAAALLVKKMGIAPETVERGDFEIGRFEITREQYAAFDPAYSYPAGTAHYPANGVKFDDARRYCEWLSRKSGQHFRLGTQAELERYLKPAKGENTLDTWAGYPVNSDDSKRLASAIEGLGPGALLRPVGSSPGNGDDPIYDLGGNVAEWVVAPDGTGKVLGGSADRPADLKSSTPARPDYIGFRVVKDAR